MTCTVPGTVPVRTPLRCVHPDCNFFQRDAGGEDGCVFFLGNGVSFLLGTEGKGIDRGRGMWKNDYDMCTEEEIRWKSGLFL